MLLLIIFLTVSAGVGFAQGGSEIILPAANDAPLPGGASAGLTLEEAIGKALANSPDLAALSHERAAREARIRQAGALPNPEISLEVENVGGTNDYRGFNSAENTLSLSQTIEIGGKSGKRARVASFERDLTGWDIEAKRLDVMTEVKKTFTDVLGQQQRAALADELVRLAEQSYGIVSARVEAGKVSPVDETKASAALAMTKIEQIKARQAFESARMRLATVLGDTTPIDRVDGRLEAPASVPSFDELTAMIGAIPEIARWEAEIEQRRASLALEKANRLPDPKIGAGIRQFRGSDDTAYVFGITVPLPVFNTNRGVVLEAESRVSKAERESRAARLKVLNSLNEAHQTLSSSFREAAMLRDSVLPSLQSAFESVTEGYQYRKFGFLDVLDAQRSLFEARKLNIEALVASRKALADIERLTGKGMQQTASKSEGDKK
jgi:cobalt-zinc-cadmium efflux system outer membrane protein